MFAVQGFKLVKAEVENNLVNISLLDLRPGSDHKRIVHCSQFVVTAWINFRQPKVVVNYLDSTGMHRWSFIATEEGLKQVVTEIGVDFEHLAEFIEFKQAN